MPDLHRTPIDPRTGEGGQGSLLDRFRLDGRVAIVTGASSELGAGFAVALASAGATVVLAARRRERLESLAQEIRADGGTASTLSCDVVDPAQCADLVRAAMDEHGRVDVLVNNAGLGLTRDLAAQWGSRRGIRVNAVAPGYFASEMTDQIRQEQLDALTSRTIFGRLGHQRELDSAVLFLASDASSFVTGSTLAVDGGMTLH